MARSLIDIAALDLRIQEQIAKYGSFRDFHLVSKEGKRRRRAPTKRAHRSNASQAA